ncbi:MAG: hypothetical protein C4557_04550, partial [Anaerolineaceae bacterium]
SGVIYGVTAAICVAFSDRLLKLGGGAGGVMDALHPYNKNSPQSKSRGRVFLISRLSGRDPMFLRRVSAQMIVWVC